MLFGGLILVAASSLYYRLPPQRADVGVVFLMGLCLYFNQLFYILGLKMAGVVLATCMQPSIPIFTVALAMLFNLEGRSYRKVAGILLAAVGSGLIVYGAALNSRLVPNAQPTGTEPTNPFVGALCLVGNCFAMACYFIFSRRVASRYPPVCITAWAYITASFWMGATAIFSVEPEHWNLPQRAHGPLLYWIFVSSILAYSTMTTCTRYLPATQVSAFVCLQPLFGSVMAVVWLGESVDVWDLGGMGVLAGLGLVLSDRPGSAAQDYEPLPPHDTNPLVSLSSRGSAHGSAFAAFHPAAGSNGSSRGDTHAPLSEPLGGQAVAIRVANVSGNGNFVAPRKAE